MIAIDRRRIGQPAGEKIGRPFLPDVRQIAAAEQIALPQLVDRMTRQAAKCVGQDLARFSIALGRFLLFRLPCGRAKQIRCDRFGVVFL